MHTPYEQILSHPADFRVSYRFYTQEEGGRYSLPFQGYRSDFWYEHPDHKKNELFMIWPEFEDENGAVILDNDVPGPDRGTARMWIIVKERRAFHKDKIKPGMKGYFMEGSRRVAECTVIEVLDLLNV